MKTWGFQTLDQLKQVKFYGGFSLEGHTIYDGCDAQKGASKLLDLEDLMCAFHLLQSIDRWLSKNKKNKAWRKDKKLQKFVEFFELVQIGSTKSGLITLEDFSSKLDECNDPSFGEYMYREWGIESQFSAGIETLPACPPAMWYHQPREFELTRPTGNNALEGNYSVLKAYCNGLTPLFGKGQSYRDIYSYKHMIYCSQFDTCTNLSLSICSY